MNTVINTPLIDFRAILGLGNKDTLDGYRLSLSGFIPIQLEDIEKAYLEADSAGLFSGVTVQFVDNGELGVVIGRNLNVASTAFSPAQYPIRIHSPRGRSEYSLEDVRPLKNSPEVRALLRNGDIVEGRISAMHVDFEGFPTCKVGNARISMNDVATLELTPTSQQ